MRNQTPEPDVVTYAPGSQMRSPGALATSLLRDLRASRELSWRLFVRDLAAQYRQSLLGIVWAFVPPIVTSAIFILLHSRSVIDFGKTDVPYPVYVMVGTVLWQMFVEAINAPLKSVTAAKPMLAKINFPREALIVSAFYTVLYGMAIKLLVILGILLLFGIPLTWGIAVALAPMLLLVLVGMALGLLVTPFGLLYADVTSGLPVATQLLFFVTPVVYAPPDAFPFSLIRILNPVSPPLMAARDLITTGQMATSGAFWTVSLLAVIGSMAALAFYRLAVPILIERTSA
jgi:homopolymeric O-antigen transport system permease protein